MKTKILAALLAGVLPISFSMSAPAMAVEKNSEKTTTAAATVVKTDQKTDTDKDKKITTVEPRQRKLSWPRVRVSALKKETRQKSPSKQIKIFRRMVSS